MKIILNIIVLFLFFFSMAMFGFYISLDSFVAINGLHYLVSCVVGVVGLIFSALLS